MWKPTLMIFAKRVVASIDGGMSRNQAARQFGFLRATFTLPVEEARARAREFLRKYPAGGYMTIVSLAPTP